MFDSSKQRTLQQSVEEYLHEKSGKHHHHSTTLTETAKAPPPAPHESSPKHNPTPHDVDRKIAEQIQQFESLSESQKKKLTDEESSHQSGSKAESHDQVAKEINPEVIPQHEQHWDLNHTHCHTHVLTLDRFDKPFEVLEEVKESEEEWESPQRSPRPLVKAKSADATHFSQLTATPEEPAKEEDEKSEEKPDSNGNKTDENTEDGNKTDGGLQTESKILTQSLLALFRPSCQMFHYLLFYHWVLQVTWMKAHAPALVLNPESDPISVSVKLVRPD